MAKRTKAIEAMIDYYNTYLENNYIGDEYDDSFLVFTNALLAVGAYKGYSRYKYNERGLKVYTSDRHDEFSFLYIH